MLNPDTSNSAAILEQLILEAEKQKSESLDEPFIDFIKRYYAFLAYEDLSQRNIIEMYDAVSSHWQLIQTYKKNDIKVRVFNPSYPYGGLNAAKTMIEVVCKDIPFLVDSLRIALINKKLSINLLVDPGGMRFQRFSNGQVRVIYSAQDQQRFTEAKLAIIALEIEEIKTAEERLELEEDLLGTIKLVNEVVFSWDAMCGRLDNLIGELKSTNQQQVKTELVPFIKWILDDNFIMLGSKVFQWSNNSLLSSSSENPDLGLLAISELDINKYCNKKSIEKLILNSSNRLIIKQLPVISIIHRSAAPYLILIRNINKQEQIENVYCFIGLFTGSAYHTSILNVPLLCHKAEDIRKYAQLSSNSYSWRQILALLQNYPRDEVFLDSAEHLYENLLGIYQIQERKKIKLFFRKDVFAKYFSFLVYIPREQYNSDIRERISNMLKKELKTEMLEFNTFFSESILARIHFLLYFNELPELEIDVKKLERKIINIVRSWKDSFYVYLRDFNDSTEVEYLQKKYHHAFSINYQNQYSVQTAAHDIQHLEKLQKNFRISLRLYKPLDALEREVYLKIYFYKTLATLSEILPIIENLGFNVIDERTYKIKMINDEVAWICDLRMLSQNFKEIEVEQVAPIFEETFRMIWSQEFDNDAFNKLITIAIIHWRDVNLLRAYGKYMRQICLPFSQSYIESCLVKYPNISKKIIKLFHDRFDLANKIDKNQLKKYKEEFFEALDLVELLDEDRIFRKYLELIINTVRTNYYQDQDNQECLVLKLSSADITEVPLPKPKFEFFIYSATMEGVHLRTSTVARGGLRWSDRQEDYRTEVLGLMKAQQVKNAVIVPSGAKGGFIVKSILPNNTNEEVLEKVKKAYTIFISGMLSLEDNLFKDEIIKPKDVVCYDDDDYYLVVAADKGTATFSDIANKIAQEKQFWLNDAFASGGSVGYDHKAMGITARSAWESVKRHCIELGFNPQTTEFMVIGIGDMSGDVFGNGMLLSKKIKLIAAFNHKHIFIDPSPDATSSYDERKRLFELPRSSWSDYNQQLLSQGGGIFNRAAKKISISKEMQKVFSIEGTTLTPNQLIKKLLKTKVDLLWSAGIGTYVKSKEERHQDVGDPNNNTIRINGSELKAKIVGEGGNLGLTQLGRIEYALAGGLSFTDFIDNVGGVDCSDHEVNIKILLNNLQSSGKLTYEDRNILLDSMEEEVAQLVLMNSYNQSKAINFVAENAVKKVEEHLRFIDYLVSIKYLDRDLEFITSNEKLLERKSYDFGLTRPELAVLFAYSKNLLKKELTEVDLLTDSYLLNLMSQMFPKALSDQFFEELQQHPLRNEIIAMELSNDVINLMGPTFIKRLNDETGASSEQIVKCFIIAIRLFNMNELFPLLKDMDNQVNYEVQIDIQADIIRLIRRSTRWLIKHKVYNENIKDYCNKYSPKVIALLQHIKFVLRGSQQKKFKELKKKYINSMVAQELALIAASEHALVSVLEIVYSALTHNASVKDVARIYFSVGAHLQLDWLRKTIDDQKVENNWDVLARAVCKDDIDLQQIYLTERVLGFGNNSEKNIKHWINVNEKLLLRWYGLISDLKASNKKEFSMFSVALRELKIMVNQTTN